MNSPELFDRRQLLKSATGMLTGLVLVGSPLAAFAKSRAWAIDLTSLSSADGLTLSLVARTLFPHDKLDDLAYAQVIQSIDGEAAKNKPIAELLDEGLRQLPCEFARLPELDRVTALKKIESSEFFQIMRQKTVQLLYSSSIAYAYFGYEGEAFSKGGYLFRGFNDLRWLPDVPADDSGPLPTSA